MLPEVEVLEDRTRAELAEFACAETGITWILTELLRGQTVVHPENGNGIADIVLSRQSDKRYTRMTGGNCRRRDESIAADSCLLVVIHTL